MGNVKKIGLITGVLLLFTGLLAGCKGSTAQKEPPVEDVLKAVQEAYGRIICRIRIWTGRCSLRLWESTRR